MIAPPFTLRTGVELRPQILALRESNQQLETNEKIMFNLIVLFVCLFSFFFCKWKMATVSRWKNVNKREEIMFSDKSEDPIGFESKSTTNRWNVIVECKQMRESCSAWFCYWLTITNDLTSIWALKFDLLLVWLFFRVENTIYVQTDAIVNIAGTSQTAEKKSVEVNKCLQFLIEFLQFL